MISQSSTSDHRDYDCLQRMVFRLLPAGPTFAMLALMLLSPSCLFETLGQDRECRRLVDELSTCLGVDLLPSDCQVISSSDVRTFASALDASGCDFLQDAIPVDGDLRSSSCRLYGEGCYPATPSPVVVSSTRYPLLLGQWNRRLTALPVVGSHRGYAARERTRGLPCDVASLFVDTNTNSVAQRDRRSNPRGNRKRKGQSSLP